MARSGLPRIDGPRSWREELAAIEPEALPEAEQHRNAYVCPDCGGVVVTVDRHEGVTPMFLTCRATADCRGQSVSCMYRLDMLAMRLGQQHDPEAPRVLEGWPEPTWEWYAPSAALIRRLLRNEPATAEHCRKGGLLLRRIEV